MKKILGSFKIIYQPWEPSEEDMWFILGNVLTLVAITGEGDGDGGDSKSELDNDLALLLFVFLVLKTGDGVESDSELDESEIVSYNKQLCIYYKLIIDLFRVY